MAAEATLDADLRAFDDLREQRRATPTSAVAGAARARSSEQEARIGRRAAALEAVRAEAAQLDVARATAEADLTHLAAACVETVQATLDEVAAEVEQLERDGLLASPRPVDDAPEPSELDGDGRALPAAAAPAEPAQAGGRARR